MRNSTSRVTTHAIQLGGFFRVHLPLAYKAEEWLAGATETIRYVGRGTWKRCSQWRKHLCYLDPPPSPKGLPQLSGLDNRLPEWEVPARALNLLHDDAGSAGQGWAGSSVFLLPHRMLAARCQATQTKSLDGRGQTGMTRGDPAPSPKGLPHLTISPKQRGTAALEDPHFQER